VLDDSGPSHLQLTTEALMPLHPCARLRHLSLTVSGGVSLTDNDIASFVSHFPSLKHIRLLGLLTRVPPSTPKAYAAIVISCPAIQKIELEVSATVDLAVVEFQPSQSLRLVNVCDSPIREASEVALFMDRLSDWEDFNVDHWVGANEERQQKWLEVRKWLPILRRARLHKRSA